MTLERSVVDSSCWIELFTDGPQPDRFLAVLQAEEALVIPAISILDVFKWILREHSEAQAIQAVAVMQRGLVVDLDTQLVIAAAQLSHATARCHQARLYTMDADFQGLSDVALISKR